MTKISTALTALLITSATVILTPSADAADKDGAENWDGNIEFSAANATGNTENTYLGLSVFANRKIGRFTHRLDGGINYAESTVAGVDAETQNNFFVGYQLDWAINDRLYGYGRARYEQDEFSGFEDRTFLGAGLGYHVIKSDRMNWRLEGGPGYQLSHLEISPLDDPLTFDDEQSEFAFYAAHDFDFTIREGIFFEHNLDITWTEPNTTFTNVFALTSQLSTNLSSKISYQTDHETDPPLGREDTDTFLKASILYGF